MEINVLFGFCFLFIGYLCGSVLFGVLIGKLSKKDPRNFGSKSAGATNVGRTINRSSSIAVFLLDAFKGYFSILICYLLSKEVSITEKWVVYLSSIGSVLGHCWPIFFRFRGGKGVATTIGCLFAISPPLAAISVTVWFVVVVISNYVSVGSLAFAWISWPLVFANDLNYYYLVEPISNDVISLLPIIIIIISMTILITLRHWKNIVRLYNKDEAICKWAIKLKKIIKLSK